MDEITVLEPAGVEVVQPAKTNPALVYLASLPSANSRYVQRVGLNAIAQLLGGTVESLPWHELRYQHTQALRARLIDSELSPASINRMLAALRGTLKQAWRLGLINAEDYQRAVDIQPVRGTKPPRGRDIQPGEIAALIRSCDDTPSGVMDAALIALGVTCGLRRSELAALDVQDYDKTSGALRVRGKGNKTRIVYAANGTRDALDDWLHLRGDEPGPLFCHIYKNGKMNISKHITGKAIYNRIIKLAERAGVVDISPHDLRRTCAGDLLDAGIDISTVAGVLGHANVTTTQRYDRRGDRVKQQAATYLHVPYQKKFLEVNND